MADPGWQQSEDTMFEESREVLRRFAQEHPDEVCSFFAYSVDAEYAGVGVHLDTPGNSLARAQAHQRYQVRLLNEHFARERGWESARYYVASPTSRIDDCNLNHEFRHELIAFIPLPPWEDYFNASEEAPELEGRVIVGIWRAV